MAGPVNVMDGRYGPYVKWAKVNATIPKESDPQAITMEEALALIEAQAGQQEDAQETREKACQEACEKGGEKIDQGGREPGRIDGTVTAPALGT